MNINSPREGVWPFISLLVALCVFGLMTAWLSFRAGGFWDFLGIAALCGTVVVLYAEFIEPKRITVKRYREALVFDPKTWIRVAFLSDLHAGGGALPQYWERVAREVQALAPDLIILGGDFVADRAEPVADLEPFAKLHASLGKMFVMGNHDYVDQPQHIRKTLMGFGYTDMMHKSVTVAQEGHELEIHGLDDHWYGTLRPFARKSKTIPHLLISHEPDVLMDLQEGDTDLVLSGHTHGGQVRFPLIGSVWVPAKLGRAVDRGRKRLKGVTAIISNGLGEGKWRPRFFSPPQIVIVEVGL